MPGGVVGIEISPAMGADEKDRPSFEISDWKPK